MNRFKAQWLAMVSVAASAFLMLEPIAVAQPSSVQPAEFADNMKKMFETFGAQSKDFMPGMFSELSPEQLKQLENVSVSVRDESAFGAKVLADYEASLKAQRLTIARQGELVEYLQSLAQRIKPLMINDRRYKTLDIAVVASDRIDAYSIPGGHLIFTTGLIDDCLSEAALAGVIGHELSHLDRGHQLLPLKQQKSLGSGQNFQQGMLWVATLAKPMRPEFESQADSDATKWMLEVGYDARELAHLLERWAVRLNREQGWANAIPDFARSHPDSQRRAQAVLAAYDAWRGNKNKLIVGEENLKLRKVAR